MFLYNFALNDNNSPKIIILCDLQVSIRSFVLRNELELKVALENTFGPGWVT